MKRSKFSDEQILAIVKEGEAGRKVADLCRANGITEQTYYRWKATYGGMELSEMQRLKQLEDENSPAEIYRRRADPGHPGAESSGRKKVVDPIARREAVGRLPALGTSLRRACRVIGLSIATWRYVRHPDPTTTQLLERLQAHAADRPRFGDRRLHTLVRRDGFQVNHKRVYGVYRGAGLQVRRQRRKRVMSHKSADGAGTAPFHAVI
jgi:putative transposase